MTRSLYTCLLLKALAQDCHVANVVLLTRTAEGFAAIKAQLEGETAEALTSLVAGEDIEAAMDAAQARTARQNPAPLAGEGDPRPGSCTSRRCMHPRAAVSGPNARGADFAARRGCGARHRFATQASARLFEITSDAGRNAPEAGAAPV